MDLEDLSFSGLVDRIQHNEHLAGKYIIEIVKKREDKKEEIRKLQKILESLLFEKDQLSTGVTHVIKHLKFETPLVVSDKNVTVLVNQHGYHLYRKPLNIKE